ncbi:MAG: serpin family protein [Chloroflexi bacterium]|nr:serpin family protein [Chloroflexota bacterium]
MRPTRLILLPALIAVLISACGGPASSANVAQSDRHRETNPAVAENGLQTLTDGNNAFALDIYHSLRAEDGNLILSPYSISLALAMTYAGARGETESQMADVLHFDMPQNQLHPAFNALDLALEKKPAQADKKQEPLQLNIANAVWAEQTFPFLQEYLDTIAANYGAGIHLADFINQYESARKEINGWVSDQTKDKINDLLPQGSLNPDTRMVLVNAIYFKADWLNQFDPDSTETGSFHLLDSSQVEVDMMHEDMFNLPYMQGNGYQAVELPYAGETAAMDIIVPDEGNFEAFDSSFNMETYDQIIAGMQPSSVALGLPKFEFTKDFNLSDKLKDMGMPDAFDRNTADFSGMTGGKDLFISDVIHKAFVAVDEDGTEAAAATAVIMELAGAMMYDINLTVDRPFIFIIRDTVNGQILFIGRVLNPAQ